MGRGSLFRLAPIFLQHVSMVGRAWEYFLAHASLLEADPSCIFLHEKLQVHLLPSLSQPWEPLFLPGVRVPVSGFQFCKPAHGGRVLCLPSCSVIRAKKARAKCRLPAAISVCVCVSHIHLKCDLMKVGIWHAVQMPLGPPASSIGVPGFNPGSACSFSFLLMLTMGSEGPHGSLLPVWEAQMEVWVLDGSSPGCSGYL